MKIKILDKSKKKNLLGKVRYLGIESLPGLLIRTGKEKIYAYSGDLSKEEIMALWGELRLEGIGLYIGKEILDRKTGKRTFRLSIDALHLLQEQIKETIKLDKVQAELWLKGKDISLTNKQVSDIKHEGGQFIAVSDGEDILGTGKLSQDKHVIYTYLPKERRKKG
ncbi:MAG: hypothetical protein ACP5D2_00195 [Candidatus Nanoarchaeia archaeon]